MSSGTSRTGEGAAGDGAVTMPTAAHPAGSAAGDGAVTMPARNARTMRGQRMINLVVRGLLRTPLVCRLVGARLVTVYVIGRASGRRYTVPVAYTRHDGALLIGSPFPWIRNLRTGHPVDIRLRGRRRPVEVTALRTEADVVAVYGIITRDNHQFATLNGIGLDTDGNPDPADLHRAWRSGARAARLTPRSPGTLP